MKQIFSRQEIPFHLSHNLKRENDSFQNLKFKRCWWKKQHTFLGNWSAQKVEIASFTYFCKCWQFSCLFTLHDTGGKIPMTCKYKFKEKERGLCACYFSTKSQLGPIMKLKLTRDCGYPRGTSLWPQEADSLPTPTTMGCSSSPEPVIKMPYLKPPEGNQCITLRNLGLLFYLEVTAN